MVGLFREASAPCELRSLQRTRLAKTGAGAGTARKHGACIRCSVATAAFCEILLFCTCMS